MKLQFDANQQFPLDAVAAITDLFDGQPQSAPEYAVIDMGSGPGLFAGQQQTELGAGNQLLVAEDKLLANTRVLQIRNDIEVADPKAALEAWELFDGPADRSRNCPHFSVEMETGTGKTYVYLQNETELTRSTLVRILKESGRLGEFFNNPQRFLDAVATILKHELHRLLVDGIKYERIDGTGSEAEWEMLLFKNEELINYLTALQVKKSVYEYVVYDSEVEREFAQKLDQRPDIKLFVKLPGWFEIDTPVGKYNPDWAILKHDDKTLYLVRETKSTKDFLKLRTSEADKVRCGQKHFETLGVPFAVAVTADEV